MTEAEDPASSNNSEDFWRFTLAVGWLILLLVVGLAYFVWPDHRPPDFGPVPPAVPWFGALGATILTLVRQMRIAGWTAGTSDQPLTGVDEHAGYAFVRPLIGVVLGIIAYLILLAGLFATGATAKPTGPSANVTAYVLAFIVGLREDAFQHLIKKTTDAVLGTT